MHKLQSLGKLGPTQADTFRDGKGAIRSEGLVE